MSDGYAVGGRNIENLWMHVKYRGNSETIIKADNSVLDYIKPGLFIVTKSPGEYYLNIDDTYTVREIVKTYHALPYKELECIRAIIDMILDLSPDVVSLNDFKRTLNKIDSLRNPINNTTFVYIDEIPNMEVIIFRNILNRDYGNGSLQCRTDPNTVADRIYVEYAGRHILVWENGSGVINRELLNDAICGKYPIAYKLPE